MLHGFESDGFGLKMAEFCQHGDSVKGLLRLFPDSKSDSRSSSSEKVAFDLRSIDFTFDLQTFLPSNWWI